MNSSLPDRRTNELEACVDDDSSSDSAAGNPVAHLPGASPKPGRQIGAAPAFAILLITTVLIGVAALAFPRATAPVLVSEPIVEKPIVEKPEPAPVTSPPSRASSVPRGGRSRAPSYAFRGDITDIFCRPAEGETEEAWRIRVPSYCLE